MDATQTKGNEMKTTTQEALKEYKAGNVDKAWEIAQQDEGLLPEVTKTQWVEWAAKIAARDETKHVAETIVEQMGGMNKISAMTGATNFVNHGNGVSFKFKGSRKYNYFKCTLDKVRDLYDVTFSKVNKWGEQKNEKTMAGIYWDQLKRIFEGETGLYLSL